MNNLKPAHKGTVTALTNTHVTLNIDNEDVILPKKLIVHDVKKGDTVYLATLDTDDYKRHHEKMSKTILNTIFKKKS